MITAPPDQPIDAVPRADAYAPALAQASAMSLEEEARAELERDLATQRAQAEAAKAPPEGLELVRLLGERGIAPRRFSRGRRGWTLEQHHSFLGREILIQGSTTHETVHNPPKILLTDGMIEHLDGTGYKTSNRALLLRITKEVLAGTYVNEPEWESNSQATKWGIAAIVVSFIPGCGILLNPPLAIVSYVKARQAGARPTLAYIALILFGVVLVASLITAAATGSFN